MGKYPFESKTMWGIFAQFIAFLILKAWGVEVSADEQTIIVNGTATAIASIIAVAGAALGIYGRIKATKSIGLNKSGFASMRAMALLLVGAFLALALAGCATTQMPKPKSPAQALLYAEASYTSTVRAATKLVDDRLISTGDAQAVQAYAHDADRYLDEAWEACGLDRPEEDAARLDEARAVIICTDEPTAAQKLEMAERTLDVITRELQRHGR